MTALTLHGTAIAAPGFPARAVLLLGPPGAGKSDLALRLIDRGWRLIADDRVVLSADGWVSAPPALAGLIEARGVGILPMPALSGPVPLALVLDLAAPPERLPRPGVWTHAHAPGVVLPLLALDPAPASAPLHVEQALQLHGNAADSAAMPAPESPLSDELAPLPLLAISGMSGAGRSSALKALEDLGYEVIDNLPLALVDTLIVATPSTRPFAFGIDSRTRGFDAEALVERLRGLRASGHDVRLVYLDCADDELVRRFSETRRRHPLAADRPAADGILRERELTAPLRRWADLVFDTSDLSVADLRRRIAETLGQSPEKGLTITLQSFGFAYGLPRGADLVFDMRFLANPHWDTALRPLTGEDPRVTAHVEADPAYQPAFSRIADLLLTLFPGYRREGKAYLTIAIGCTGGRHRSVAVARALQKHLADAGNHATLSHRDIHRASTDSTANPPNPLTSPPGEGQRAPR
jgi:RNase adaptor protein for sRNA GlmZ degradation